MQDASLARNKLTWVLLGKDSRVQPEIPPAPCIAHCKWCEAWYIESHYPTPPIGWTDWTCSRMNLCLASN